MTAPDSAWTGLYRAGQHGGGDAVYRQLGPAPDKNDPRVCIAFPGGHSSGATVAKTIIDALNAAKLGDSARATGWLITPADNPSRWNLIAVAFHECRGCGGRFTNPEEHACPGGTVFVLDEPGSFEKSQYRFTLSDGDS
jgi:hypothetical protein